MSKIPANIRNFVKQEVEIPADAPLLPVFEAVHNAMDAIVEGGGSGTVKVTVERHPGQTDRSRGVPFLFTIEDDGVGLNDDNMASFDELFTTHKLLRGGKGRGRFTFLKAFDEVQIDSVFADGDRRLRRVFNFDFDYKGAPPPVETNVTRPLGTKVVLRTMFDRFAKVIPKDPEVLARDFIVHFMAVLLAKTNIQLILNDGTPENLADIVNRTLLIQSEPDEFTLGSHNFSLHHVRLRPGKGLKHRLTLAAAAREVLGTNLVSHIPLLTPAALGASETDPGYLVWGIVQGTYLDENCDPTRMHFREEKVPPEGNGEELEFNMFGDPRSVAQVRDAAIDLIRQKIQPQLVQAETERLTAINDYVRRDGLGYHYLRSKIPELAKTLAATDDRAIEKALHAAAFQERQERSEQVSALLKAHPKEKSEKSYFDRWTHIISKLSEEAKSDLADYVVHRKAILELLEDLLKTAPTGNYTREEVLHSIIFPKNKQSGDVGYAQQNLWLIDERLTFHEHLYSDISIKKLTGKEDESLLRPDLAIFESGFAAFQGEGDPPAQIVIVELKQPGRDDLTRDDPYKKVLEYHDLLITGKAKTEGNAVIQVDEDAFTTAYLVNDWTADFKKLLKLYGFKKLPGEGAKYLYREEDKLVTVAISYRRMIDNARRRNRIFFRKLGIEN